MIEKISEATAIVNEKSSNEGDLLDYIDKEKRDKKNGHGEDISVKVWNIFPDLFTKKTDSKEQVAVKMARSHQSVHSASFGSEKIHNLQQRQEFFASISAIKSKATEKTTDIAQTAAKPLLEPRVTTTISIDNHMSGKLTKMGEDEVREQKVDSTKLNMAISHTKNDLSLIRQEVQTQEMKPRAAQPSVPDRVFQANMNTVKDDAVIQKKPVSLDYPFLRWSGEHSVKVSIPVDANQAKHLTLLPSDTRSAEMLSRQVGQLNGYTTDLLHPQKDDEESEQRQSRQYREEDQE